ncbi:hypothetical protein [Nocardia bovistercoris]|uniref:Uncharacterized protein n=1 Tax=Nocardia bovistercoris TaxID=2785916 RepID=A0A931N5L4_9NOCA|nr:hypothetical protein [Nocardia bovistercoris]MBH0779842.1 hypothetical protein [Nocardia bovistercoris]
MRTPPLPVPELPSPWHGEALSRTPSRVELAVRDDDGHTATVRLQRCTVGRLRDAYPVAANDVDLEITDVDSAAVRAELLGAVIAAIHSADPRCRRVVVPFPAAAADDIAAAREVGLHPVVEVDVPGGELALLVAVPAWVRAGDEEADRVPGA